MSKYISGRNRCLNSSFWDDEEMLHLEPAARLFFVYVLTNESTNLLGIYKLPVRRMAFDMRLSEAEAESFLEQLEKVGVVKFSRETSEIAIRSWLKYELLASGHVVDPQLDRDLAEVQDIHLIEYVVRYAANRQDSFKNPSAKRILTSMVQRDGVTLTDAETVKQNLCEVAADDMDDLPFGDDMPFA